MNTVKVDNISHEDLRYLKSYKLIWKRREVACLDRKSTITKITVFPAELGRCVMKSSESDSQILPGI